MAEKGLAVRANINYKIGCTENRHSAFFSNFVAFIPIQFSCRPHSGLERERKISLVCVLDKT